MVLWYQRLGDYTKGFTYVTIDFKKEKTEPIVNEKILEYIKSLKIPPAYKNVVISSNPKSKVLAYGYDSKNRKQVIYHPTFINKQAEKKFEKILKFEKYIPIILKKIKKNLINYNNNTKEKGLAVIISLIIQCGFRIGNEKYKKSNKSYGLSTLECRHIRLQNNKIEIKFIGKKGVENCSITDDKHIVSYLLHQLKNKSQHDKVFTYEAGERLLNITSNDVNEYIKSLSLDLESNLEITSKDLRTWNANHLFLKFINKKNVLQDKNPIQTAIKMVSEELHNTPAVCKSNYLHPEMIEYIKTLLDKKENAKENGKDK